jgi:hypothetical protein
MLVLVLSMGIYLQQMRRGAAAMQRSADDARPVAPPATGPTETVTLYVADDTTGELRPRAAQIPLPAAAGSVPKNCCAHCSASTNNRTRPTHSQPPLTSGASF